MAHNLYANGARFISKEAAWHGLGKVKGNYVTREEVQQTIDYPVTKEQLSSQYGPVDAWGTFAHLDGKVNFLGAVGEGYTILPASKGLEGVDLLMDTAPALKYQAAGVLGVGERVWALVNLAASFDVAGYEHQQYLLFTTSYNGQTSHQYRMTDTCVVCQNTLTIALNGNSDGLFKVRHTKSAPQKLEAAHAALAELQGQSRDLAATLNMLSTKKVEKQNVETLLNKLFPLPKGEKESSTRRDNILADILASYDEANEQTFHRTAGSAYNLLQSITGYVDHARGQDDSRAEVALFGTGSLMKQNAYEIILEQSAGMGSIVQRAWSHREQSSLLDQIIAAQR